MKKPITLLLYLSVQGSVLFLLYYAFHMYAYPSDAGGMEFFIPIAMMPLLVIIGCGVVFLYGLLSAMDVQLSRFSIFPPFLAGATIGTPALFDSTLGSFMHIYGTALSGILLATCAIFLGWDLVLAVKSMKPAVGLGEGPN